MSSNPFTIGEKAKLIANFSGIVKQGTLGVVHQIVPYAIAITFDGEDFQRVIPRSWLEPVVHSWRVCPSKFHTGGVPS